MFAKLWNDEAGLVSLEVILIGTLISLAVAVGANAVGRALNSELVELANAIAVINQSYCVSGYSICGAYVSPFGAADTTNSFTAVVLTPTPSPITAAICP